MANLETKYQNAASAYQGATFPRNPRMETMEWSTGHQQEHDTRDSFLKDVGQGKIQSRLSDLEKALQARSKGESAFVTSDLYRKERGKILQSIQEKLGAAPYPGASSPYPQMPAQQNYNQQGAGAMPAP